MNDKLPLLRINSNRRFLIGEDGSTFFWLADTAWELFHRLNREEAEHYLSTRAEQKFTVIQAVALAEFEGVTTDNAYGRRPLLMNGHGSYDPALPDLSGDYSYWDHVDYIIDLASELGLYIALLPTWGDKYYVGWGKGPNIFDDINARTYGRWLGERYRDRANIVWVLGGDRPLITRRHFAIVQAMADGLKEGDHGRHLMTFHPVGGESSSKFVHDEEWLDFNMIQSGHEYKERDNYLKVAVDYKLEPIKPTLDGEPCYEDHGRGFNPAQGYFDQADVRKAAYYALFSGAFGHTYGHHSVWSMMTMNFKHEWLPSTFLMSWENALQRPGANQMRHVRTLLESRGMYDRVPDQSLLEDNHDGSNYAVATRGNDYAMIYSPNGLGLNVLKSKLGGSQLEASWYDPRIGAFISIGLIHGSGQQFFVPPSSGRGEDWVLVLDVNEKM